MLMLVSTSSNTGNVPNTKNSSALFLRRAPSKFMILHVQYVIDNEFSIKKEEM
jgi:hypothetical protein